MDRDESHDLTVKDVAAWIAGTLEAERRPLIDADLKKGSESSIYHFLHSVNEIAEKVIGPPGLGPRERDTSTLEEVWAWLERNKQYGVGDTPESLLDTKDVTSVKSKRDEQKR
jgi:hypothetical protein